jgi:hypothetical protein
MRIRHEPVLSLTGKIENVGVYLGQANKAVEGGDGYDAINPAVFAENPACILLPGKMLDPRRVGVNQDVVPN